MTTYDNLPVYRKEKIQSARENVEVIRLFLTFTFRLRKAKGIE